MPTPDTEQQPRQERWRPCGCSACSCQAPIKSGDVCKPCEQDYHLAPEDEPEAA